MSLKKRIQREKETISLMIKLYCKKIHKYKGELCQECSDLLYYSSDRLSKCPLANNKPVCGDCTIHCFKPLYREKIRKVMRYSGPRMLLHHPFIAIEHLMNRLKFKAQQKKNRPF